MIWNAARVALCVIPLTGCAAKTGNTELRRRAAAVQLLRTTPRGALSPIEGSQRGFLQETRRNRLG